jgi:hypothetical protein
MAYKQRDEHSLILRKREDTLHYIMREVLQ